MKKNINSKIIWPGLAGLIIGALLILGIRFVAYQPETVHYHANFAVYINDQREEFKDPAFYESIGASCDVHEQMTPQERAHMHDNINDAVHVHHNAVTWGQFFANLGWVVDAKVIQTTSRQLLPDNEKKISLILNGEPTDNVSNREIGDKDKLLVDYGNNSNVDQEYASIASTADKYNNSKDPKSCGSQAVPSMRERLEHMF